MSDTVVQSRDARTGLEQPTHAVETARADVHATVEKAVAASKELAALTRAKRADLLKQIADELEKDRDKIVAAADRETGLGDTRLNGELTRTSFQLRLFASVIEEGSYLEATIDHAGDTPMGPRPDLRRILVPIGPVAVFAASNFPLAFSVVGGDTASALAAGNAVVVKVHPGHPNTSILVAAAIDRARHGAGLTNPIVQLVFGFQSGISLVSEPDIKAVGFTGSTPGGLALLAEINKRPEPIAFYGELGSINPLIITPQAATERGQEIGAGLGGSITMGGGQFCTKPGINFVPTGPAGDTVVQALNEVITQTTSFAPLTEGIGAQYQHGAAHAIELPGANLIAEGPGQPADGVTVAPTRPAVVQINAADLTEDAFDEVFGPFAIVVRYDSANQVRDALAKLPGTLTATIHSADNDPDAPDLVRDLAAKAGRVLFNGYPTGVAVAWAQTHGGPFPSATTVATSVGATSIVRFLRPVSFQNAPEAVLPEELRENYSAIPRRIDGVLTLADTR